LLPSHRKRPERLSSQASGYRRGKVFQFAGLGRLGFSGATDRWHALAQ
jgi:hypothetical protein